MLMRNLWKVEPAAPATTRIFEPGLAAF